MTLVLALLLLLTLALTLLLPQNGYGAHSTRAVAKWLGNENGSFWLKKQNLALGKGSEAKYLTATPTARWIPSRMKPGSKNCEACDANA